MTAAFILLVAAQASVDVKIDGEGYFRFARESRPVYAKAAKLVVDHGRLCSADGPYVVPEMPVNGSPDGLRVSLSGDVYAHYPQGESLVGRLVLVQFGLDVRPVESKGFLICSGKGEIGEAGQGLFGVVRTVKPAEPEKTGEIKIYDDGQPVVKVTPSKPENLSFLKAGGVKVTLYDSVAVEGDTILLGEVADVSASADVAPKIAAIEVGVSPKVGVKTSITRGEIERAMTRAGLDVQRVDISGPGMVRVARAFQEIDQENFVRAALEQSKTRLGDNVKPAYDPNRSAPLMAPKGELEFEVENIEMVGTTASCKVAVKVDGKRWNSRTVNLKVEPVATTLKVRVGDAIDVRVIKSGVTVETKGRVRSVDTNSGRVTVEVEPSKALVYGQLLPDGKVEVKA